MLELKSDLKSREMIGLNDRTRLIVCLANLFLYNFKIIRIHIRAKLKFMLISRLTFRLLFYFCF